MQKDIFLEKGLFWASYCCSPFPLSKVARLLLATIAVSKTIVLQGFVILYNICTSSRDAS